MVLTLNEESVIPFYMAHGLLAGNTGGNNENWDFSRQKIVLGYANKDFSLLLKKGACDLKPGDNIKIMLRETTNKTDSPIVTEVVLEIKEFDDYAINAVKIGQTTH